MKASRRLEIFYAAGVKQTVRRKSGCLAEACTTCNVSMTGSLLLAVEKWDIAALLLAAAFEGVLDTSGAALENRGGTLLFKAVGTNRPSATA